MGRKPIIREAILNALKKRSPLRFKDIRAQVAVELGRNEQDVGDQNVVNNLTLLVDQGQVAETNINGKKAYALSNSFFKTKNKMVLKEIVDDADLEDFYPLFESSYTPLTAYFQDLSEITNPLRKKKVQHFCPELNNWSQPVELISRRMIEAYTDLKTDYQTGIAQLLAYAYWYGAQELIKDFAFQPLHSTIDRSMQFAFNCIENAKERGDFARVEAEKKVIEILEITKKITLVKNLNDLLLIIKQYSLEIKKLQNEMLSYTGQYMAAGEKIFDRFLDFHSCVMVGLESAGFIPEQLRIQDLSPKLRYFYNYDDVWNDVIPSVISEFNTEDFLQTVQSDLDETLVKIDKNEKYFFALLDLPSRSKLFIFYIWGYDQIFEVSNRDFLPKFDQWFTALKEGNLDHRSWIFDEKQVIPLINAYKEVSKGKQPQNGIIDLESWTISDLYTYHPQGKDSAFWKELLTEINKRMQLNSVNPKLSRHIEAVLAGGY